MADDEEVIERDEDEQKGGEDEEPDFKPGELCPVDAVREEDQVDLTEGDDEGLGEEEKENILKDLVNRAAQRDLTSYRLQIRDAWKARYFYRGNQFLLPGRNGAWVLPQLILVGGQSYDDHNQETNIYLAFADTIIAALTAGNPSVRFEPDEPDNPADVAAAENSSDATRLIERANNMVVIQEDVCRFLWTDAIAAVYTHYVIDAQRFGYETKNELEDEMAYLPEEKGNAVEEESFDRGDPRGQEVIEAFGALEVKVPIQARNIHECDYLQLSREFDITRMKTKYPEKAKDIQAMASPAANTEYARLARTSIMTGMRPSNMTNDAMTYQTTETLSWFRPSFFRAVEDKKKREWLYETFPKGAMVAMVGKEVVECRREQIDDHWTVIPPRPGDGMHRPALGQPIIPLQEKLNDCMDYVHDAFMHLVPLKWVDSEAIDTEALQQLQTKPNQYVKMKRRPDKELATNFFVEPQIQLAEGLLVYIENLFAQFSQFLCGAFPALFGGDTGTNDTLGGISIQRDQALGRLGLTWRNLKAGYANIMRQAVGCAAKFRNSPMSGEVPAAGGVKEHLRIDPEDLKGNIRCYPDTDENFPESWVMQRAAWNMIMTAAATNPILQSILAVPRNMSIAKDKLGLPELSVPAAAAANKQQAEIMVLLHTDPLPNPKLEQAKQAMSQLAPPPGTPPEMVQQAQAQLTQAVSQIPQLVSSVPIDEELDDHANEMAEIKTWANTPEGIKERANNPNGFINVRLHYDEHKAALTALVKQQQMSQQPAMKPVSESISTNFKDLPPEGQMQVAQKLGIQLNPQGLQQNDQLEKAKDIKALASTPKIAAEERGGSAPPTAPGGPPPPAAGAAPPQ